MGRIGPSGPYCSRSAAWAAIGDRVAIGPAGAPSMSAMTPHLPDASPHATPAPSMTRLPDIESVGGLREQPEVDPQLFRLLATDPVSDLLGIHFESITPGYARASMLVTHEMLNAPGTAHGGAMMALIDVVHAAVSNSHGVLAVAQDVHTEFLAAGAEGDELVCEGFEISRTTRTAVYRIDVHAIGRSDRPGGRLLATALARVFRIGTPWLPAPGEKGVLT